MITILKPGSLTDQKYHCTCIVCACVFTFMKGDAVYVSDRLLIGTDCKSGTALRVKCPTCQRECYVYDP